MALPFSDADLVFRNKAMKARSVDELIGLCKGVVADGCVNQKEAQYILNWMEANQHAADEFPASVLYPRLARMLSDGRLDDDEAQELLAMLRSAAGEQGQKASVNMSTALIFDDPSPEIVFVGQSFCLTGKFALGLNSDVEKRISNLGGTIIANVLKKGCVLVVGCMASEAWLHSTHGTKIKTAIAARDEGKPVVIISEEHWNACCEKAEGQR